MVGYFLSDERGRAPVLEIGADSISEYGAVCLPVPSGNHCSSVSGGTNVSFGLLVWVLLISKP